MNLRLQSRNGASKQDDIPRAADDMPINAWVDIFVSSAGFGSVTYSLKDTWKLPYGPEEGRIADME
jgi:hypothetical protein